MKRIIPRAREEDFRRAVGFCPRHVPQSRSEELLIRSLLQDENPVRLEKLRKFLILEQQSRELAAAFRFLVGRIGEDDVEVLVRLSAIEKSEDFPRYHASPQFRLNEILFDRLHCRAV